MKNDPIIVLPRTEPDLDGVACAVAYAEFLNSQGHLAMPWYKQEPDSEAQYLIRLCNDISYASESDVQSASQFILVDASSLAGFPDEIDPNNVIEVIDHRFPNVASDYFKNAKIQIERVGAAVTLIAERFIGSNIRPSKSATLMLFGALHSNTQCLKGTITSDRDREVNLWLLEQWAIPDDFLAKQFNARKEELTKDIEHSIKRESKSYKYVDQEYNISQLEFYGAGEVLFDQHGVVEQVVSNMKAPTILNMVDLETNKSYIYTSFEFTQRLLVHKLNVSFENDIAIVDGIILRKQIIEKIEANTQ